MQTRDATNKVEIVRLVLWWCVYPIGFCRVLLLFILDYHLLPVVVQNRERRMPFVLLFWSLLSVLFCFYSYEQFSVALHMHTHASLASQHAKSADKIVFFRSTAKQAKAARRNARNQAIAIHCVQVSSLSGCAGGKQTMMKSVLERNIWKYAFNCLRSNGIARLREKRNFNKYCVRAPQI